MGPGTTAFSISSFFLLFPGFHARSLGNDGRDDDAWRDGSPVFVITTLQLQRAHETGEAGRVRRFSDAYGGKWNDMYLQI